MWELEASFPSFTSGPGFTPFKKKEHSISLPLKKYYIILFIIKTPTNVF